MTNQASSDIVKLKVGALKKEYSLKEKANSAYSMRAFARDIGVSHTLLVLIFKGQRKVTDNFCKKVLNVAKLSPETKEILSLGIKLNLSEEEKTQKLSLNQAASMGDWVHYAILSLIHVDDFSWSDEWIAERLGISKPKALTAMKRIEELDLLEQDERGNFHQKATRIVVDNEQAFEAGKKFNKGMLQKAKESMDNCEFSHRSVSSTTFTLNPKYIPFAIEEIKKFRRKLSDQLETMGTQTEVYSLCVQLFPLTQIKTEESLKDAL